MERTDTQPQHPSDADGDWIIVMAGGQTFVGCCINWPEAPAEGPVEAPQIVTLAPCYRVHEIQMPVEVEPGRMGIQTQTVVRAPLLCVHPVPVMLEPSVVVPLAAMHEADAATWRRLIEGAEKQQQQERAARSGISLASSMPRGT